MKKLHIMFAAAVMAIAMMMTGCGKASVLSTDMVNEKRSVITLENASKDAEVTVGTFVLGEGEKLVIEPELEGNSRIRISFIGAPEEGIEEMPTVDATGDYVVEVAGKEKIEGPLAPGSYLLQVTVLDKSTGTVVVSAQ